MAKFSEQLEVVKIEPEIEWEAVFKKYFSNKPPFSNKKKKNEFPDAFVIEQLEGMKLDKLYLVACDPDFDSWAESQENVVLMKSIKDLSDFLLTSSQATKIFKNNVSSIEDKITADLVNRFSSTDEFELISYHSEIEVAAIKDILNYKYRVLSFDRESGELIVDFKASGIANLEISSPVIVYDSVDKEDIRLGANQNSINIDCKFSGELLLNVYIDEEDIELVEVYNDEVESADFEVPHEWESFLDE